MIVFYYKNFSIKWSEGITGTCQTCYHFAHFFEVFLGCKMGFKCPRLLKLCQNVGDMDRPLCQKMGSLVHLEMETQPKVTFNFLKREF